MLSCLLGCHRPGNNVGGTIRFFLIKIKEQSLEFGLITQLGFIFTANVQLYTSLEEDGFAMKLPIILTVLVEIGRAHV